MKTVYVFNGGGVRGLISLNLLLDACRSGLPKPDLVCGTSTGAIIAGAISIGMDYSEIKRLYIEKMPKIFGSRQWFTLFGIEGPKYSAENLRKSIYEIFGDKTNLDCKIPLMVNSWNITQDEPVLWKSWKQERFKLTDVIIASCSAETFFMPHTINNDQYVDGGTDTNLGSSGYTESRKLFGVEEKTVAVFGTGDVKVSIRITNGGIKEWLPKMVPLFLRANNKSAQYCLQRDAKDFGDTAIIFDKTLAYDIPLDDYKTILKMEK